jgi:hypothetical protein
MVALSALAPSAEASSAQDLIRSGSTSRIVATASPTIEAVRSVVAASPQVPVEAPVASSSQTANAGNVRSSAAINEGPCPLGGAYGCSTPAPLPCGIFIQCAPAANQPPVSQPVTCTTGIIGIIGNTQPGSCVPQFGIKIVRCDQVDASGVTTDLSMSGKASARRIRQGKKVTYTMSVTNVSAVTATAERHRHDPR